MTLRFLKHEGPKCHVMATAWQHPTDPDRKHDFRIGYIGDRIPKLYATEWYATSLCTAADTVPGGTSYSPIRLSSC